MNMLFAGPIERRVSTVLKRRIAAAEKEHAEKSAQIDERAAREVELAYERADKDKDALADTLVESILGR